MVGLGSPLPAHFLLGKLRPVSRVPSPLTLTPVPHQPSQALNAGEVMCRFVGVQKDAPGSGSSHVGARPGIDFDEFPLLDEEGDLHDFTGFERCWLLDIICAVPTDAFGRFRHFKVH